MSFTLKFTLSMSLKKSCFWNEIYESSFHCKNSLPKVESISLYDVSFGSYDKLDRTATRDLYRWAYVSKSKFCQINVLKIIRMDSNQNGGHIKVEIELKRGN